MAESLLSRSRLGVSGGSGVFTRLRWVDLPGTAGNYLSVPDSVAVSITGDITIEAHVALDDWTPSSSATLVSKFVSAGQRSYRLTVLATTGRLYFESSADGTAILDATSSVAPTVADGAALWVRVTVDVNDGSGNRVAKFWTSPDGATWTQLGATQTAVGATSIFDSTSIVEAGSTGTGAANLLTGKVYRARIYNADIGSGSGTPVLDIDAQDANPDNTVSTFPAPTGQTVTINRNSNPTPASVETEAA